VVTGPRSGEVSVSATAAIAGDAHHAFELWGIADSSPRALGLLSADRDHPLRLNASAVPAIGDTLAVSVEPVGGSPTGLPTGAVLYQGKVLASLP
jgi:anti-sigma-K factor RskA